MKTRYTRLFSSIALVITTSTAAATQYGCPAGAPAQQLAEATNARWGDVAASRDPQALAALYAENAVLMPPTDETIVGRGPIAEYLAGRDDALRPADYTVDVVGCELVGDTLEIAGVWGTAATGDDGKPRTRTGNVMRVANRQADGSFVLKYEIWN